MIFRLSIDQDEKIFSFFSDFRKKFGDRESVTFSAEMSHPEDVTELKKWEIISRYNYYIDPQTDKIQYGGVKKVASECEVSVRTVSRVRSEYQEKIDGINSFSADLAPMKKGHVGKKSGLNQVRKNRIIRCNKATKLKASTRKLAELTQIPKSTLARYLKEMKAHYSSSYLKPAITDGHK